LTSDYCHNLRRGDRRDQNFKLRSRQKLDV